MAQTKNYLLGYGERLTAKIDPPGGGGPKAHPYTFEEAKTRLKPRLDKLVEKIDGLPKAACPNDQIVAILTLHPTYMAKSYFPTELLGAVGLRHVGSRRREVRPEKWGKKRHKEVAHTTELFVAGPRQYFREWVKALPNWTESTRGSDELIELEDIYYPSAAEKLKPLPSSVNNPLFEVVLHANAFPESEFVISGFEAYVAQLGIEADMQRRITVGGLCFLPIRTTEENAEKLAEFSFLRVARVMPKLRDLESIAKSFSTSVHGKAAIDLPDDSVLDSNVRVAIFDGGLPKNSVLSPWATAKEPKGIGKALPNYLKHGQQVTSALLFGPLKQGVPLLKPACKVDHWRVLDDVSGENDLEMRLFDVIQRIHGVLTTNRYDFINLSLGPDMPMEDDEVHVWTAVLDDHLSSGETLATIAVGNNGEGDVASGLARIQPPSDCVNAMAVGACDSTEAKWKRATYSAIGPGRNPGVIKPDAVFFGGTDDMPFVVLDANGKVEATSGTSFSAPAVLRLGVSVKAILGTPISSLGKRHLSTVWT